MTEVTPEPLDLTSDRAKKAIGISVIMVRLMIPCGFVLMFASLMEGSWPWAVFICLTGWWGIVMGLSGAHGLMRQQLMPTSREAQVSGGRAFVMALFLFWIPTLANPVLAGILLSTLQEDHRPVEYWGGIWTVSQSLAMYMLDAGFAWTSIYRVGRKAMQSAA